MKPDTQVVRTRMAPSPTGVFHIGTLRTALFNYIFAKQNNGVFVVRIEDTDKERSKKEYENEILTGFELAGLHPDELYRQSERHEIYHSYLSKLIEDGFAYVSKEEAEEGKRGEVIRFKNPNKLVSFEDEIRGTIEFDTTDLGDFVIAKSLDEPLYHLAVVVDDHEMNITHIIRGEEHIANTPRQILIQEAIGAQRPTYAHLPLILAPDRSKLSKRHGAVAVSEYLKEGFLPEAIINYMALLGWSPQAAGGSETSDLLTLKELIDKFELKKVQKGGAIFNIEKMQDLNKHYIAQLPENVLVEKIRHWLPEQYLHHEKATDDFLGKLSVVLLERLNAFGDLRKFADEGDLDFFFNTPSAETNLLLGKKGDLDPVRTASHLSQLNTLLGTLSEGNFSPESVKNAIWDYASEIGRADVLWPMRAALTGRERSADPFNVAAILGKQETLKRIEHAIQKLT